MMRAKCAGFLSMLGPLATRRPSLLALVFFVALLFGAEGRGSPQEPVNPLPAFDIVRTDAYKPFMGWSWFVNSKGLAVGFHEGSEAPQLGPKIHQVRSGSSFWSGPEYFRDPDDILFLGDGSGHIREVLYLQTLQWRFDYLPYGENLLLAQTANHRSKTHDLEIVFFTRLGTDPEVVKREIHIANRGRGEVRIALVVQDARVMWLPAAKQEGVDLFALDGNAVLVTGPKSHKYWDKGVRVVGSWHAARGVASGYIVGHGVGRAGNRLGYLGSPAVVQRFLSRKDKAQYPMARFADLERRMEVMSSASEQRVNYLYFAPAKVLPQATLVHAFYQFGLFSESSPLDLGGRLRDIVGRLESIDTALRARLPAEGKGAETGVSTTLTLPLAKFGRFSTSESKR